MLGACAALAADANRLAGAAELANARLDLLEKSPRTPKDLECPHGVQFYDVVLGGERHVRNAWIYEWPQPAMMAVTDRVGFWRDVKVG